MRRSSLRRRRCSPTPATLPARAATPAEAAAFSRRSVRPFPTALRLAFRSGAGGPRRAWGARRWRLRGLRLRGACFRWRTPAAAAASAAAPGGLGSALGAGPLVLLRLRLWSALLLRAAASLLLRPPRTLLTAASAWAALLFRLRAVALLELGHFPCHEPASLRLLLMARLVVTAIRAAAPPLGVRPFAGGA